MFRSSRGRVRVHGLAWALLAMPMACRTVAVEAPPGEGLPVLPVVLVAGQSNAVGFDAPGSAYVPEPGDADVLLWWRVGDPPPDEFDSVQGARKWVPLQPQPRGVPMAKGTIPRQYGNFHDASGGFGPEVGLARTVAPFGPEASGDPRLAIIKVAFSGTSLLRDWDPADRVDQADRADRGACYRSLVNEAGLALEALRARGFEPEIRGLAWIQGESDATEEGAQRYAAAMERFLASLRSDLAAPQMRAVLAINTKFGRGANPWVASVAAAQNEVGLRDPLCAYVDTSAATIANNAHYDAAGTLLVGRLMGEALGALRATSATLSRIP